MPTTQTLGITVGKMDAMDTTNNTIDIDLHQSQLLTQTQQNNLKLHYLHSNQFNQQTQTTTISQNIQIKATILAMDEAAWAGKTAFFFFYIWR